MVDNIFLRSNSLYFSPVSFPLFLFFLLFSLYHTVPLCQSSLCQFLNWLLHNRFWWIGKVLLHKLMWWFQDFLRIRGLSSPWFASGCGGTDPPLMSDHNRFQIIADSAGCAFVRLNSSTVTVRETFRDLCFGMPPLEFLHNVAQSTRRMTESSETAMPNVPVFEMAWFGDWLTNPL